MACCATCAAHDAAHAVQLPPAGDVKYWAVVAAVALGVHVLAERWEHSGLGGYLSGTMSPTPAGTRVREVMSPAAAWALGSAPAPPTPAERHVPL